MLYHLPGVSCKYICRTEGGGGCCLHLTSPLVLPAKIIVSAGIPAQDAVTGIPAELPGPQEGVRCPRGVRGRGRTLGPRIAFWRRRGRVRRSGWWPSGSRAILWLSGVMSFGGGRTRAISSRSLVETHSKCIASVPKGTRLRPLRSFILHEARQSRQENN